MVRQIDRQIGRQMHGWMDGWTDGWMDPKIVRSLAPGRQRKMKVKRQRQTHTYTQTETLSLYVVSLVPDLSLRDYGTQLVPHCSVAGTFFCDVLTSDTWHDLTARWILVRSSGCHPVASCSGARVLWNGNKSGQLNHKDCKSHLVSRSSTSTQPR